jgi:HSP20 family protein
MSFGNPYRRRRGGRGSNEDDFWFGNDDDFFGFSPFRGMFEDVDQLIESMMRTMRSAMEDQAELEGRIEEKAGGADLSPSQGEAPNTVYYGFQVTVGPDGRPHVREFGNVKPTSRGEFKLADAREPFVDTMLDEKENQLKVIAEMPGIQKEDIALEATEDSLTIRAHGRDRKYETRVPLKKLVDPESSSATFKNGILEVRLKLKPSARPSGFNVSIG